MRAAAITLSLAAASAFSVLWAVQHGSYKLLYCDSWLIENRQRVALAEAMTEFARVTNSVPAGEADSYLVIAASNGKLRFRVKRFYWRDLYRLSYVTTKEYAIHLGLLVFGSGLPAVLLTVVPLCRRRARHHRQRCVHCGYDLRASMGRCPECGQEFAPT